MALPSLPIQVDPAVSWAVVVLGVVTLLWNKLDRRFDGLEARLNKQFDDLLKADLKGQRREDQSQHGPAL